MDEYSMCSWSNLAGWLIPGRFTTIPSFFNWWIMALTLVHWSSKGFITLFIDVNDWVCLDQVWCVAFWDLLSCFVRQVLSDLAVIKTACFPVKLVSCIPRNVINHHFIIHRLTGGQYFLTQGQLGFDRFIHFKIVTNMQKTKSKSGRGQILVYCFTLKAMS